MKKKTKEIQTAIQKLQEQKVFEEGIKIIEIIFPAMTNLNKLPCSIRLRKLKSMRLMLERFMKL